MPESAVSAFAKTWPTPCQRQRTPWSTVRHRRPSNNLPAELLLIIFKLVYQQELRRVFSWQGMSWTWQEDDLRSPSLFPYAIAAVCSLWRDVMSLVPEYWTRVVILVDAPATPLLAIPPLLSWSRDLPIDVTLTRRAFDNHVDGPRERTHLRSAMNALETQIHRVEALRLHTMFSSSLPSFPGDFHGDAKILKTLELRCNEDDGGFDSSQLAYPPDHEPFQCPVLSDLVIDGRNCYNAHMRGTRCTDIVPKLEGLAVSHFKPQPGESFSAYDLLHPLAALEKLICFSIANFTFDPANRVQLGRERGGLEYLDIKDCHDFQDITDIFRIMGGALNVSFTRCLIGAPAGSFQDFDFGAFLTLRQISGDQDLVPLLCSWDGLYLTIEDCTSFDDTVLAAMCAREDGKFTCAPDMDSLEISTTNHATFSVAALKRFVETRFEGPHPNTGDENFVYTPFDSIEVKGSAPHLSHEDRMWFVDKTRRFLYP